MKAPRTHSVFAPRSVSRPIQLAALLTKSVGHPGFTPDSPWVPGRHEIVADKALEDLASNGRPFEVDATRNVTVIAGGPRDGGAPSGWRGERRAGRTPSKARQTPCLENRRKALGRRTVVALPAVS